MVLQIYFTTKTSEQLKNRKQTFKTLFNKSNFLNFCEEKDFFN